MDSDIIFQLKSYFSSIYDNAFEKGDIRFDEFLLFIEDLPVEHQIIAVISEIEALQNEISGIEKKEYVELAYDKEWLLKCFTQRFLVYNVNDTVTLETSLVVGLYQFKLRSFVKKRTQEVQQYSFNDFLGGKKDILFNTLYLQAPNIPEIEHKQIYSWQTTHFFYLLESQCLILQKEIRKSISDTNYVDLIQNEITLIDLIFANGEKLSPLELVECCKELKAFGSFKFDEVDINEFHSSLANLKHNFLKLVTPILCSIVKLYNNRNKENTLNSSLAFLSIDMYYKWLIMVLKGELNYNSDWIINYDEIISDCKNSGIQNADNYLANFLFNYPSCSSSEAYKTTLINEADNLRKELNGLNHLQYFATIDNEDSIKPIFKHLFCLSRDSKAQIETLIRSFELDKKIEFIISKLSELSNESNVLEENQFFYKEWQFMSKELIVDSDILEKQQILIMEFEVGRRLGRIPFRFLLKNFALGMEALLNEALTRLQSAIDNSSTNARSLFIQSRLKNLRNRSLNARRYGFSTGEFHSYFKEFLEIEAECLKEALHLKFKQEKTFLFKNQNKLHEKALSLSFGFKAKSELDLKNFFSYFNIHIDFINEQLTTEKDFINILSTNDLSEVKLKIHLNCETVQFIYILEKLKPYFSSLTPTTIERSGVFFSKNGTPLKASNLFKNKIDNPKKQGTIDNYFKNLPLKE